MEEGKVPGAWQKGNITKPLKKCDLSLCSNYRSTNLLSVSEKIFHRVQLQQLRQVVDRTLIKEQVEFRKKEKDEVFVLLTPAEQSLELNSSLYIDDNDFEKAFGNQYSPPLTLEDPWGSWISIKCHQNLRDVSRQLGMFTA